MKPQDLTSAQWRFLAAVEALGGAATVELLGQLVPLTPGPLVDLIARAVERGWLTQEDSHILCLAETLPTEVRARLARINSPSQIGRLLKRFRAIGRDDASLVHLEANLLQRAGQAYAAALIEFDAATRLMEDDDLHGAMAMAGNVIARLTGENLSAELSPLYVKGVLFYARLSYLLGEDLPRTPQMLESTLKIATAIGDRRSLVLIRMYIGTFHYLHDELDAALEALSEGLEAAASLGDEDILIQCAEFEGIYYYIQGLYRQAYEAFERAIETSQRRRDHLFNHYLPIFLGQSAAILGRFHRAIGVLNVNLRRARMAGQEERATLYEATLGMVLMRMGRKSEALHHLYKTQIEATQQNNDRALYFAQRGIIYYHYLEGQLKEVEQGVRNVHFGTHFPHYSWPTGPQYIWPIILEIIAVVIQLGFEPPPQYDVFKDMEKILKGPNLNLRGTVYRLQAQGLVRTQGDRETIRALLLKSEADLLRSADPLELAKTHIELARLCIKENQDETARSYALHAWEGLSGHWENLFPVDLRMIVHPRETESVEYGGMTMLDGFIDVLDAFVPSADEEELLGRLMSATCHFFGAERGGLFWVDPQSSTGQLHLRAAYNLMPCEMEDALFRHNLSFIRKVLRNNQPLLIHDPDASSPRIICLPIEIHGVVSGVLYHENLYITEGFHSLDRKLLMRISRHVSAYIERIGAYCRLIERMSVRANRQAEQGLSADYGEIVAGSECMRTLLQRSDQVAASEATVIILGETGVGKELLARRVHAMSNRRDGPFLTVDLTSIPEHLVESELFGHEKGAFTGADRQKLGRMEHADKGTLFIDEVGEIPLSVQVKLLRALQEHAFVRVGGTRTISADFRLVAATNRDLASEVERGNFREDLYYRLNVVPLLVPPLRERGADTILLAQHFLAYYERKYSRGSLKLSEHDRELIAAYPWPGNVRELKNTMERAAILSAPGQLELALPVLHAGSGEEQNTLEAIPSLEELERRHIQRVLAMTGGRIGGPDGAARLLGVKRTTLYARMKKLGVA